MESLKAGRELDEIVATDVMGWKKIETISGIQWIPNDNRHPNSNIHGLNPPDYSTDMSAAWEVVEKLSVAYMVSVRVYPTPYSLKLKGTEVKIYTEQGHRLVTVCEDNKDTPLVICLAALELKDMVKKYESRT